MTLLVHLSLYQLKHSEITDTNIKNNGPIPITDASLHSCGTITAIM